MTVIALTVYNDRSISPETVSESFAAPFLKVAHVLDAKIPISNIYLNYFWKKVFLATSLHIQATVQKFLKSL